MTYKVMAMLMLARFTYANIIAFFSITFPSISGAIAAWVVVRKANIAATALVTLILSSMNDRMPGQQELMPKPSVTTPAHRPVETNDSRTYMPLDRELRTVDAGVASE